jgi:general secretion pathway protein G
MDCDQTSPAPKTSPTHARRRAHGFTLIEIMAVVLIMGLLMGLVGVSVFSQVDKARVTTAQVKIKQLENALEFYRMDNSRYPTTEQGLRALIEEPSGSKSYPPGGYLQKKEALKDPWEEPFQYESPGQHNARTFDIWSLGADSAPGGSDLDSDIGNWSEDERS